nr:protein pbdc1 like [Quercus suber]
MPGSKLRLTKFDDEILEHFNREFPDFDLKGTINEDDMKSKAGKERWRNFIQEYEKKVEDYNYGTMLRANAAWEYGRYCKVRYIAYSPVMTPLHAPVGGGMMEGWVGKAGRFTMRGRRRTVVEGRGIVFETGPFGEREARREREGGDARLPGCRSADSTVVVLVGSRDFACVHTLQNASSKPPLDAAEVRRKLKLGRAGMIC